MGIAIRGTIIIIIIIIRGGKLEEPSPPPPRGSSPTCGALSPWNKELTWPSHIPMVTRGQSGPSGWLKVGLTASTGYPRRLELREILYLRGSDDNILGEVC